MSFPCTVDPLYTHVLYKHTHDISTKPLGPIALLSVQVSVVVCMGQFCMTFDIRTARNSDPRGVLIKRFYCINLLDRGPD